MVIVAAAIIIRESKVLIAKRSLSKFLGGFWEFPGGKIERDETPEDCLIRELEEELEIIIEVESFLTEDIYNYGSFQILLKAYLCRFISGDFILNDHEEIKWVEKDQILSYKLAPADISLVDFLLTHS